MKRYLDLSNGKVWTLTELKTHFENLKGKTEDTFFPATFEEFISLAQTSNNGVLEEIATEEEIIKRQMRTASEISAMTGYFFDDVLNHLQQIGIHSNWTSWEIANRPADIEELAELVSERM